MSESLIIGPLFEDLLVDEKTTFREAIIDDPKVIDHIERSNAENVPKKLGNKSQLRSKLKSKTVVEYVMKSTRLPGNDEDI